MTNKVLEWKNNGETIKRRPGEEVRINLCNDIDSLQGNWRAEPVVGKAVEPHQQVWKSGRELSFGYDACSEGQSIIQILYRVGGVIEKIFNLTVDVVPLPAPPPIKMVYVVVKITRRVFDPSEYEIRHNGEQLGIACSPEGAEDLISQKHPGVSLQWKECNDSVRVDIKGPTPDDDREVYIIVTKIPLHW